MDIKPEFCENCACMLENNNDTDFDTVSLYYDAEDFSKPTRDDTESPIKHMVFEVDPDGHEVLLDKVTDDEVEMPTSNQGASAFSKCFFTLNSEDVDTDWENSCDDIAQGGQGLEVCQVEMESLMPDRRDYRSNSFGILEKKKLSPIVERKTCTKVHSTENLKSYLKDNNDPSFITGEGTMFLKRKTGIAGLSRQSSKEQKALIEASSRSCNPSPNIERMIKDLFIHKSGDEQSFKAIDPLEVERKISFHASNFLKFKSRSKSYNETRGRVGSLKNLFSPMVMRFLSRDSKDGYEYSHSSGSLERRRAYSDNTYSDGGGSAVQIDFNHEDIGDDDCFWNDVCFTPRLDRERDKQRQKDYRRNSSPEAFPEHMKLVCLLKKFGKDKKEDKTEKKKSTPKLERKGKSDKQPKLSRENSLSSPWGSRKGTPKLSRESSLASPMGSKKGTPKLSRESSLASPMGSRKSTPKLSREGSYGSPFCSKKGTPKLSRESSIASPKGDKTTFKMPKVTSMPQLHSKKSSTPKLERRKSTPKLRRKKDSSHERVRKKMSDSELNKRRKELDLQLERCTSTPELSRKRLSKGRSREKSFEGVQGQPFDLQKVDRKNNRKSRRELYMCEQDEKQMIENWLNHVSFYVGILNTPLPVF